MFRLVVILLSFCLLNCFSSIKNTLDLNQNLDFKNLDWLWHFDYSKNSLEKYYGFNQNDSLRIAYLFKKIKYEEKYEEYLKKAIKGRDNLRSKIAGLELLKKYNEEKNYSKSELIGELLFERFPQESEITLEYFKSLYWQKKNELAIEILNAYENFSKERPQINEFLLFKAALLSNLGNFKDAKPYFYELFLNISSNSLHKRAYDYLLIDERIKNLDTNMQNLLKFRYNTHIENNNQVLEILNTDLSSFSDSFTFLYDSYIVLNKTNNIHKAITFFNSLDNVYKYLFLGLFYLKLNDVKRGLESLEEFIKNDGPQSLENKYKNLALQVLFNALLDTNHKRQFFINYFPQILKKQESSTYYLFNRVVENFISKSIKDGDWAALYNFYVNSNAVLTSKSRSALAFLNARAIHHDFLRVWDKEKTYNDLLNVAFSNMKNYYYSFLARSLLEKDVNDLFVSHNKREEKAAFSAYEDILIGFLNFNLYDEFLNFLKITNSNNEKLSDNLYQEAYNEMINNNDNYNAMKVKSVFAEKKNYNLTKDDFKNLHPYLYKSLVDQWSERRNLDPRLVLAMIHKESSFKKTATSRVGAKGLMQLMPTTAREISEEIKYSEYDLENPKDNIILGTYYMKRLVTATKGDIYKALVAYNAGIGNLRKWEREHPNLPAEFFIETIPFSETKNYVKLVLVCALFYDILYFKGDLKSMVKYILGDFN